MGAHTDHRGLDEAPRVGLWDIGLEDARGPARLVHAPEHVDLAAAHGGCCGVHRLGQGGHGFPLVGDGIIPAGRAQEPRSLTDLSTPNLARIHHLQVLLEPLPLALPRSIHRASLLPAAGSLPIPISEPPFSRCLHPLGPSPLSFSNSAPSSHYTVHPHSGLETGASKANALPLRVLKKKRVQ